MCVSLSPFLFWKNRGSKTEIIFFLQKFRKQLLWHYTEGNHSNQLPAVRFPPFPCCTMALGHSLCCPNTPGNSGTSQTPWGRSIAGQNCLGCPGVSFCGQATELLWPPTGDPTHLLRKSHCGQAEEAGLSFYGDKNKQHSVGSKELPDSL